MYNYNFSKLHELVSIAKIVQEETTSSSEKQPSAGQGKEEDCLRSIGIPKLQYEGRSPLGERIFGSRGKEGAMNKESIAKGRNKSRGCREQS